jgi:hypothetical protein
MAHQKHKIEIQVEITRAGSPTPAQAAAWRKIWLKLLSKGQEQPIGIEAAAGQESDQKE